MVLSFMTGMAVRLIILMEAGSTQLDDRSVRLRDCCQVSLMALRPSKSPGASAGASFCTLGSPITRSRSDDGL